MGALRRIKTLLPLPSHWRGEERSFGNRLEEAYEELQMATQNVSYGRGGIASAGFFGYGYIHNSSKTIRFDIPMDKLIPSGAVTVKSCKVIMRGISGLVNSISTLTEYVGRSGYTVTAEVENNGRLLKIIIDKSSAFTNVTNNTPIVANGSFSVVVK